MATTAHSSLVESLVGDLADIHAPRGGELSCRGWQQEAALRMLMNNLDPEVAEDPDEADRLRRLGQGGAQLGGASTRSSRTLRRLEDDETLLVQSGKPVAVFRTHRGRAARADRQLACWCRTGPPGTSSGGWRPQGLTMYGQMTAGSWIYIGTQGILQGTYETLRGARRAQHFGGSLTGGLVV